MKSFLTVVVLLFVLQSCNKNRIEHNIYTNIWELTLSNDEFEDQSYIRMIEYYDVDGMINEKKNIYKSGNEDRDSYTYNESNQLIKYKGENFGISRYYYDKDILIKKEFYSTEDKLQSYRVFEYSNSLIDKVMLYFEEDELSSITSYYYTSDRLDSIITYDEYQQDIITITRYSYDDINNTMEEELWTRNFNDDQLSLDSRRITTYDNKQRIIGIEYRWQDDTDGTIWEYQYDSFGKKNKIKCHDINGLIYIYTANYSAEEKNHFIIPEH